MSRTEREDIPGAERRELILERKGRKREKRTNRVQARVELRMERKIGTMLHRAPIGLVGPVYTGRAFQPAPDLGEVKVPRTVRTHFLDGALPHAVELLRKELGLTMMAILKRIDGADVYPNPLEPALVALLPELGPELEAFYAGRAMALVEERLPEDLAELHARFTAGLQRIAALVPVVRSEVGAGREIREVIDSLLTLIGIRPSSWEEGPQRPGARRPDQSGKRPAPSMDARGRFEDAGSGKHWWLCPVDPSTWQEAAMWGRLAAAIEPGWRLPRVSELELLARGGHLGRDQWAWSASESIHTDRRWCVSLANGSTRSWPTHGCLRVVLVKNREAQGSPECAAPALPQKPLQVYAVEVAEVAHV